MTQPIETPQVEAAGHDEIIDWLDHNPHIAPNGMERGYVRIGLLTIAVLGVCVLLAWLGVIA